MTSRPLRLASVKPCTAAMLTALLDGSWHPTDEVRAVGAEACITQEQQATLAWAARIAARTPQAQDRTESDLLRLGAKGLTYNRLDILARSGRVQLQDGSVRLAPEALEQWRRATGWDGEAPAVAGQAATDAPRNDLPGTARATQDSQTAGDEQSAPLRRPSAEATEGKGRGFAPLVFAGVTEDEGWGQAPLRSFDLVHFRSDVPISLDELRDHLSGHLPEQCTVSVDTTDLYRVFVPPGAGATIAELTHAWCRRHGALVAGLRTDRDVRRRALSDLDPAFLDELVRHYLGYGMRRLQKHMSTVLLQIPEYDDVQQQLAVWILDAVIRYDDSKGVPFGAWLSTALSRWVHDLNRSSFGRTAADAELKQHRAVAAFTQAEHRAPTDTELAEQLGTTVASVRRNRQALSVMNGMRSSQSLDTGGFDDGELAVAATGLDPAEQLEDSVRPVIVSSVLTNACAPDPDGTRPSAREVNVIGWVTWVNTMYQQQTRTEVAAQLGTSMRNLHVHSERAAGVMAERMPDALGMTDD